MNFLIIRRISIMLLLLLGLTACGNRTSDQSPATKKNSASADHERGPHHGRLLRDGSFAVEVTVDETGVPPQFRLYAYQDNKPLPAQAVQATVDVTRLDDEISHFAFRAKDDALIATSSVAEPHSFDVKVSATHAGKTYQWEYASYEGRVVIPAATAAAFGVETAQAGPTTIHDTLPLLGQVTIDRSRFAQVRARFPGIVRSVSVNLGDRVKRGQRLATVEGNQSMRTYALVSPLDGVVLARDTNAGEVAGDRPLFEIADLSSVWVELHAVGSTVSRLQAGQSVVVRSATGGEGVETTIDTLVPVSHAGLSVVARASLANPDAAWRPGMPVVGEVIVAEHSVPLAVAISGLQRFRDFSVVFAQVGETYEVRMLELGARDGQSAEVLSGLKPGTTYVTEQSFLIRADIEKSGATHDH